MLNIGARGTVSDDDVLADCYRRRELNPLSSYSFEQGGHQRNRNAARVRMKATSCCLRSHIKSSALGAAAYR